MLIRRSILMMAVCCSIAAADESYLDSVFRQGAFSWSSGDARSAANLWLKYIEVAERLYFPETDAKLNEVRALYEKAKEKLLIITPPVSLPAPSTSDRPQPIHNKPLRRSASRGAPSKDPALIKRLVRQAEKAEVAGRYEEARSLLRLALQYDSSSEILGKKLQDLDNILQ